MTIDRVFFLALIACGTDAIAADVFLEAEAFRRSSAGWKVFENAITRAASDLKALNGATGDSAATATADIDVPESGSYRIWVRHSVHKSARGPFLVEVKQAGMPSGKKVFDTAQPTDEQLRQDYLWDSFDVRLKSGQCRLALSKHRRANCQRVARNVDCILLTTNLDLAPDHTKFGPQTWLRVSLADGYEMPLYVHIFADRHRAPHYAHWHISKAGIGRGSEPALHESLASGEQTVWCNITPLLYQDYGAILHISARHRYQKWTDRFEARLDFATEPNDAAIVRTIEADCKPNGLAVVLPPNLTTAENRQRLRFDREFAEATGEIADRYSWPTIGKKPQQIPFFVTARFGREERVDQRVLDREWNTLDYFGFSNRERHILHGNLWPKRTESYCRLDLDAMRVSAANGARRFSEDGHHVEEIAICLLTDEPPGQSSVLMAKDPDYQAAFRDWLRKQGRTPDDLGVANWDAVKPINEAERDRYPHLHYPTQRFRTRALGNMMAVQRRILEAAYGRKLLTAANFADGATFQANFFAQGVDYFELLDSDDQNAIWSEDWANLSSSYQCGAYNVDLMRAAARERGQTIGHHLIAYARRKPWDIKTKAASETARGVRIWNNFRYGPGWSGHNGGPVWQSHAWYHHPKSWRANAEVVHEIGGAEDMLVGARAEPAKVAILYASSSDAWMLKRNRAFGFERMHTWMALAHAQVPLDFVAERQVEGDALKDYSVVYFFGPNLTTAAAIKLKSWVEGGGTLFLGAGAAMRDENNQPLAMLNDVAPAVRSAVDEFEPFYFSGRRLSHLTSSGTVLIGDTKIGVLSVRQQLRVSAGATVLGRFDNKSPALVRGRAGQGTVYCAGFLPALDYIHKALTARLRRESQLNSASTNSPGSEADQRLLRSRNPWEFPEDIRAVLLTPVRGANVDPPLKCSVPLIDAVPLRCDRGIVIPLANYTLTPLNEVEFTLQVGRDVDRIESVHQGDIDVEVSGDTASFSLPLAATDYVKVYWSDVESPSAKSPRTEE